MLDDPPAPSADIEVEVFGSLATIDDLLAYLNSHAVR
jgi:hypothetical protein